MKLFTHFVSSAALATCIPGIVKNAAMGDSNPVLWAVLGGLVPDLLDNFVAAKIGKPDLEIKPDELSGVALEKVCLELENALREVRISGKNKKVKLNPVRNCEEDIPYCIYFNQKNREIILRICGEFKQNLQQIFPQAVKVKYNTTFASSFERVIYVGTEQGTSVEFIRLEDNTIQMDMTPEHEGWTHSVFSGILFCALSIAFFDIISGILADFCFFMHIIMDQAGDSGSKLLFPLLNKRFRGLKLIERGTGIPEFVFQWISFIIILCNLNRYTSVRHAGLWDIILVGIILPVSLIIIANKFFELEKPFIKSGETNF
jgi:hypothetical protein